MTAFEVFASVAEAFLVILEGDGAANVSETDLHCGAGDFIEHEGLPQEGCLF